MKLLKFLGQNPLSLKREKLLKISSDVIYFTDMKAACLENHFLVYSVSSRNEISPFGNQINTSYRRKKVFCCAVHSGQRFLTVLKKRKRAVSIIYNL